MDADKIYTYADTIKVPAQKIDDESVYFMKDLKAGSNVVNLSGNTMYVTSNQTDTGLAIAKDAKAVVIQKENGEIKKTEFSTVASAINYLADANETVTGKQYAGDIFALLNANTSAAWVVFNSDTELKTGTGVGGGDAGEHFKAASYIYENGFAAVSLTATRPAWLDKSDSDNLDFTFDIAVNGAPYASGLAGAITKNNTTATVTWDNSANNMFLYRPIKTGDVITVENFQFDCSDQSYFVEYVDQNGKVLFNAGTGEDDGTLINPGKYLRADLASGNLSFTISNSKYTSATAATYTITNVVTPVASTPTSKPGTVTTVSGLQPAANLKDYVRVQVDLSGLTVDTTVGVIGMSNFSLDSISGAPSEATGLKLTVSGSRRTPAGGQVQITYTASGTIAATNGYGIKATLSDGTEIIWKNNGSVPTVAPNTVTLNEDLTITVVKVEKIVAPMITSVSFNDMDGDGTISANDVITVYFDKAVASGTATAVNGGTGLATGALSVDRDGMFATITVSTAPGAATDHIEITVLEDDATGVKTASAGKWTIVTDSTASNLVSTSLTATYA